MADKQEVQENFLDIYKPFIDQLLQMSAATQIISHFESNFFKLSKMFTLENFKASTRICAQQYKNGVFYGELNEQGIRDGMGRSYVWRALAAPPSALFSSSLFRKKEEAKVKTKYFLFFGGDLPETSETASDTSIILHLPHGRYYDIFQGNRVRGHVDARQKERQGFRNLSE